VGSTPCLLYTILCVVIEARVINLCDRDIATSIYKNTLINMNLLESNWNNKFHKLKNWNLQRRTQYNFGKNSNTNMTLTLDSNWPSYKPLLEMAIRDIFIGNLLYFQIIKEKLIWISESKVMGKTPKGVLKNQIRLTWKPFWCTFFFLLYELSLSSFWPKLCNNIPSSFSSMCLPFWINGLPKINPGYLLCGHVRSSIVLRLIWRLIWGKI
jgi:hypothetical protein